jgi:ATP-dependent Lhr-like helicase
MAPITLFLREEALWMDLCLSQRQIPEANLTACLSDLANHIRSRLSDRGAMFVSDLARLLAVPGDEIHRALWELVAAGLITADGFDSLRSLIDPRRRQTLTAPTRVRTAAPSSPRSGGAAGRWSLLIDPRLQPEDQTPGRAATRQEAQIESACHMLLRRYGVVFRDVIAQETAVPRWRDLLGMFRRLEARGVVRGGRFVSGFGGEQFALPEAVESLCANRHRSLVDMPPITIAAADPANLVGVILPGERPAAIAGNSVTLPSAQIAPVTDTNTLPLQSSFLPSEYQGGALA